ncbi:MAG: hypothetical protein ABI549_04450 [Flavobacterium sp.]|uniref:hypothetical protein n=1 Tax=Flavobacterium sp. TaxID=239 RepID=UPI0032640188
MRIPTIVLFYLFQSLLFAQKPCEYSVNVTDSIGTLKETKSCLVYERVFGNSAQFVFLSLISDNGTPVLSLQIIQKSTDFITPKCLDKNSKVYFQLSNGKIYTLLNAGENECDNLIYNAQEKLNNRLLNARFLFMKDNFEDLKKYPITMMRIKLASETKDYILQKELRGEKVTGVFEPENFFIDNFSCIE